MSASDITEHHKPIGVIKLTAVWMVSFRRMVRDAIFRNSQCDRINAFVKANAEKGDVKGILQAVDDFCRENEYIMILGKYKAAKFTEIVNECNPSLCLEIGTYCGYSAILLASMIPDEGHVYTIEFDKDLIEPARELVEYAGMSDKITVIQGDAGDVIPSLREQYSVDKFDFVLMDHHKPLYYRELKHLEEGGYLRQGTVVVGDDIGWPGSPEYDEYIQKSGKYENSFFDTRIEMYSIEDVMAKSIYKGD